MKILFVMFDGGGNIPPQLKVARALKNRGADIHVIGLPGIRERVESEGLSFEEFGSFMSLTGLAFVIAPPNLPQPAPEGAGQRSSRAEGNCRLGALKVHGAHLAATVLFQLVADALFLLQCRHTSAFDGANVDERVFTPTFRRDEAITLLLIEKFHSADRHNQFLLIGRTANRSSGARDAKRRNEEPQST